MEYAERYGKENNYESIRLDAFTKNEGACKVYEKAGYSKVGIGILEKVGFIVSKKE